MADTDSAPKGPETRPRRARFRKFVTWTFLTLRVVGVISAVDAVMSNRTATGAVAWSLSLVTVPIVALPAYWVFGRNKFEGYLEARKENQEEIEKLVDQKSSVIGTHNFDNRSFRLNFEIAAVISDEEFNGEVEAMFNNDFRQCTPIDPATFADNPWYWHFGVNLSRLLAPIL